MQNSLPSIEILKQQFGNSQIDFIPVSAELIKARLQFSTHASAEIHLQGAHLTQWTDTQGEDNLFNSPDAVYQRGTAIRGGNPIIFPQFGAGILPQHGFARNSIWRVIKTQTSDAGTEICLALTSDDLSPAWRQQWKHLFELQLTLSLNETLTTRLQIKNIDTQDFSFTFGFHTYLAVGDIEKIKINGFKGCEYMDNLLERKIFLEQREAVKLNGFTDRRYQAVPEEIILTDCVRNKLITLKTSGCDDAFLWNPWHTTEKNFRDLTPNSYQKFVCIEPGKMQKSIVLSPSQIFTATQQLTCQTI